MSRSRTFLPLIRRQNPRGMKRKRRPVLAVSGRGAFSQLGYRSLLVMLHLGRRDHCTNVQESWSDDIMLTSLFIVSLLILDRNPPRSLISELILPSKSADRKLGSLFSIITDLTIWFRRLALFTLSRCPRRKRNSRISYPHHHHRHQIRSINPK